ncbi:MAG: hypothetical protein M3R21_07425 [Candidatus Dormibacteraeota bacterium]|nr:hypothetical protein [Candidatus Dormibacteraeota bacterium]
MLQPTLDANAINPDAPSWRPEVLALIELASRCEGIHVARTAGARRERSHPPGDPDAEERKRLMRTVPGLVEAFTIGASHLGDEESHLAFDWEPEHAERISEVLFECSQADLNHSNLEDVTHLHTHARNRRDLFVTTDQRMLDRASPLAEMGIRVATPALALAEAQAVCGFD